MKWPQGTGRQNTGLKMHGMQARKDWRRKVTCILTVGNAGRHTGMDGFDGSGHDLHEIGRLRRIPSWDCMDSCG